MITLRFGKQNCDFSNKSEQIFYFFFMFIASWMGILCLLVVSVIYFHSISEHLHFLFSRFLTKYRSRCHFNVDPR